MSFSNITFGSNSTLYTTFTPPTLAITGFVSSNNNIYTFDTSQNALNAIRSNIYTVPYSNTQTTYVITHKVHTYVNSSNHVVASLIECKSNATATNNYICCQSYFDAVTFPVGIRPWTGY